jgi:transcriptional regulator with XRE-family HTH domain
MSNDLRAMRLEANLTMKEVAATMGRSFEWLRRIEVGQRRVTPEIKVRIVEAIRSLQHIKNAARSQRCRLNSSLALPRAAARPRVELNI